MNILFYSALPTVRYGGVAGWARNLVRTLRGMGHRVHLLAWGGTSPDPAAWGPDLHFLPLPPRLAVAPLVGFWVRLLAAARAGRRLLAQEGIEVVQTVSVYEAYGASLALPHGRPPATALVLSIHGDFATEQDEWWKSRWRRRLYRPLERAALRRCQAITTSSAWLQQQLAGLLQGVPVSVIPNGITLPPAPGPAPDRTALGLPADRPIVLTLNSLYAAYRRKGLELLLDAAPAVVDRLPDVLFLVVGGVNDPTRDGQLVAWARRRAAGLPFEFTGFRPQPPTDLMAAADLYVHPSFLDNSPTAVMEAMLLGRPIVATRVGGIPELISNGETGLLVPLEARPLADAVVRLLEDRPYAQRLAAQARQRALKEFSWDRVGRQFTRLYEELLRSRTGELSRAREADHV